MIQAAMRKKEKKKKKRLDVADLAKDMPDRLSAIVFCSLAVLIKSRGSPLV